MKNIIYVATVLIMFLLSCETNNKDIIENNDYYFYVNYNYDFYPEINTDTTKIVYYQTFIDGVYMLNYLFSKDIKNFDLETTKIDTVTYHLTENESYNPKYFINGEKKDTLDFIYVSKQRYIICHGSFTVYKYAKNPYSIDGCITYFWTPKIGILIKRCSAWKNYSKLQTNNDSINECINLLTEMIYQDTEFYKGCNEKLQLMMETDVEEFYKWKFEEIEKLIDK